MNFREGISVKSQPWAHGGSAVNHLQPLQSLYQNEDDNLRINFCNYIEVRFKVYWPESGLKVSESKISKLNSWSLGCFHYDPPQWRGSWDWEEQNSYLFRSRRGRNRKIQSGFFTTDRVNFRPLDAHAVTQIEPQDHHRELGEVEGSQTAVVPPPEVAGGRKWIRVGFGVFETGQHLPTNISSVKVTKTFTDEIFVGKGYL